MESHKPVENPSKPTLALAIVGSNLTAVAAELVAESAGYKQVMAITRRKTSTILPVFMDGDTWAVQLRSLGLFGAKKRIADFLNEIERLAKGNRYDCFIHHSKDPFSQLIVHHPLCRKFFYIEEGITAHIGRSFSSPKHRVIKKALWRLKSALFYQNLIYPYRSHFDVKSHKYGGAYAFSKNAFANFPGRVQLPLERLQATPFSQAEIVVFLDSQYILGKCSEAAYTKALVACLGSIIAKPAVVAVKFHPVENDNRRKKRIIRAIQTLDDLSRLIELPQEFVGERMSLDTNIKIVVGTSAIGLYLGERGFTTYTFAARLVSDSTSFADMMKFLPADFEQVCVNA